MRLALLFITGPPPGLDVADDSLAAVLDIDVLDGDGLLAAVAVFTQCLHLPRVGPCQLVESPLMRFILRKLVGVGKHSQRRYTITLTHDGPPRNGSQDALRDASHRVLWVSALSGSADVRQKLAND